MNIETTSDEKFNKEVLDILMKIKEKYLATPKKQPSTSIDEYINVVKPHGVEIWLHYGDEFNQYKNIIYKLQEEWKALEVLDESRGDFNYEGTRFILKILQPKFDEVYKKYQELNEGLSGKNINDLIIIELKSGKLSLNKNTGEVKLNNIKNNLNPTSEEFKFLLRLMENKDYIATYKELISTTPTKTNKRNLAFIVRNLKKALGILPQKKSKNKDIIKNIKGHGYMLIK
jgi:hypothetical protein